MRILFVSANPRWTARPELAGELRVMKQSLADCDAQLTLLPVAQFDDLQRELRHTKFDIVHFSGQADEGKNLLFRKPDGENDPVPVSKLRALLQERDIKLAIVNTCEIGTTREASEAGTGSEAEDASGNPAAIMMVKVLYRELAAGTPAGRAYEEAKKAVDASALDDAQLPTLTLAEDSDANYAFKAKSLADGDLVIENRETFNRYFYIGYLDEQANVLKRNIKLNQYALRALVALGVGMLLFSWGESIAGRVNADFSFPGDLKKTVAFIEQILVTTGKDILAFLGLAFESVVGKAADSDAETPLLDWMMRIGEITPLAIASLQHRWCVHGRETLQEMNALRELVKKADEMSPTLQKRLDKILDQSLRAADVAWKNLREFLPPGIAPVVDDILDKNFGADLP